MNTDRHSMLRLALKPLLGSVTQDERAAQLHAADKVGMETFVHLLFEEGVAQLWRGWLHEAHELPEAWHEVRESLQARARELTVIYLKQRAVLTEALGALESAGVPAVVFKGGQLRETLYAHPTDRPVSDIDVLVPTAQRRDAIACLLGLGFKGHPSAETISHEIALARGGMVLDLHWHLLRPGRSRLDFNDYLFSHTRDCGYFTGLSNEAALVVMLVHPAITKYVNYRTTGLLHQVDVHRLLRSEEVQLDRVVEQLDRHGMKTAAWASLRWMNYLVPTDRAMELQARLEPGAARARWLESWLLSDRSLDYERQPQKARLLFSLSLQQGWLDAARAVAIRYRVRKQAVEELEAIARLLAESR